MARIILLLISPDFLASDYRYGVEMQRAMARHDAGEAQVIPILLRPVADWDTAPLARLAVLPTTRKPITTWRNRDEAWAHVVREIRRTIEPLSSASSRTSHKTSILLPRPRTLPPSRRTTSGPPAAVMHPGQRTLSPSPLKASRRTMLVRIVPVDRDVLRFVDLKEDADSRADDGTLKTC